MLSLISVRNFFNFWWAKSTKHDVACQTENILFSDSIIVELKTVGTQTDRIHMYTLTEPDRFLPENVDVRLTKKEFLYILTKGCLTSPYEALNATFGINSLIEGMKNLKITNDDSPQMQKLRKSKVIHQYVIDLTKMITLNIINIKDMHDYVVATLPDFNLSTDTVMTDFTKNLLVIASCNEVSKTTIKRMIKFYLECIQMRHCVHIISFNDKFFHLELRKNKTKMHTNANREA